MPSWLHSILNLLADPRTVISLAALAVSIWSLIRTSKLTTRQTQIASLELASRERAEATRSKADIRAVLISTGQGHRLVIGNDGGAAATEVDVQFSSKGPSPLLTVEREAKLPIPRLEPDRTVPLLVALSHGNWPPYEIVLTWTDPDGIKQRREETLYEPL